MTNCVPLADAGRRISLSAGELEFLRSASVRTADGAHNLLTAESSAEFPAMTAERRRAVVEALAPLLSTDYAKPLDRNIGRPRGAAPPSQLALATAEQPLSKATVQSNLQGLAEIDLIRNRYVNWPVLHEQGNRQACVAFAVAACLELLRAGQGTAFVPLSPQFLYYHIRVYPWTGSLPPGWEDGSTRLGQAKEILTTKGICSWQTCPYDTALQPGHPEGLAPSNAAEIESAANLVANGWYQYQPTYAPGLAREVYDHLQQGRPVAIAVPVYAQSQGSSVTNWSSGITSGEVLDPYDSKIVAGGHAVCVVGFQPDPGEAGGGWFIFRNSVGLNWASGFQPVGEAPRVPARSYGAISATYIEGYCWEAYSPILT